MGNDHSSFSRRNFLSLLGKATALPLMQSPVQILIESIVMGATQRAYAEAQGLSPRRLLHILHEGAPPRWGYDLFLTPYATDFKANKTVGTRFSADGKSVLYSTVARKGLNVPHMWQFNVPKVGGGTRPMDDLLSNMLCLRGINVANPAHGGAQAAQSVPNGATQSISALAGDPSTSPIPAVSAGLSEFRYLSKSAKSAVSIASSGNMLSTLLNPFIRKDLGGFTIKRESLASALDASIKALNISAESQHPQANVLTSSLNSAKELLSEGFGNLDQTWSDLLNKYLLLIQQSVSPTNQYVGINDKEILSDGSPIYTMNTMPIDAGTDLRTMITNKTACDLVAQHFAMAEYVLTNNLSYSVSIGTAGLTNLLINADAKFKQKYDEHQTGAMASLISNAYLNVAYSACLLELIDQLKAHGMFEETVIVSGSEFGRSPHGDGFGSGHGYSGGCSVIYSGALQASPMVLGNIYTDRIQDVDDAGTWGFGAPVAELGKALSLGNWASTIAGLLRVPSPNSASTPVIVETQGVFKPTIELAKQIT
jgi:hypothetical protein